MNNKLTLTLISASAFTFAIGCGGAELPAVSENAALTETQAEASDTASAAAELGDEELARATASDYDMTSRARPEIGAALRALIYNVKMCGDRVTIDRQLATADCNLIGNKGEYIAGVTVTFDKCELPSGGMLDGVITATTEKKLAAGQSCVADALIDVDRSISIDSLTHRRPSGVRVEWKNVNGSSAAQRPIATFPSSIDLTIQGQRQAFSALGRPLFDHLFQGAAKVSFDKGDATTAPSRTVSGQLTIQHLLAKFTATISADNVVKAADCCRPTSGAVTLVRSGSREAAHSIEFGPSCGAVALDGNPLDLPECL